MSVETATAPAPSSAPAAPAAPTEAAPSAPVAEQESDEIVDPYDDSLDGDSEGEAAQPPAGAKETSRAEEKPTEISAELLARAQQYGMSEEDAKGYGSTSLLERTLTAFDRRFGQLGSGAAKPANEPSKPETDQVEAPATVEAEEFELKLSEEDYDPEVVKQLKAMNSHYAKKFAGMQQRVQQQERKEIGERVERLFSGLGEEFADEIGKGETEKMDRAGKQFKSRVQVLQQMDALALGYKQAGMDVPSEDELFKRATRLAFGERYESIARKKLSQQLDTRRGGMVQRPTNREMRERSHSSPEAQAAAAVKAKLKSFGDATDE